MSRKEYQQNCWYHCSTTSVIRKMYQWFLVPLHWSGSLAECISKWYDCSPILVSKKMYQENCWYHCSPTLVILKMYQQHILILLQKLWKLWQELLLKNEQHNCYYWQNNGCLWRNFLFLKTFEKCGKVRNSLRNSLFSVRNPQRHPIGPHSASFFLIGPHCFSFDLILIGILSSHWEFVQKTRIRSRG